MSERSTNPSLLPAGGGSNERWGMETQRALSLAIVL